MKIFLDALSQKPTVSVGTIAYILSNIQMIKKEFPSAEIYMISINPKMDEIYLKEFPYKIQIIKRSKSNFITFFQIYKLSKKMDLILSSWGDAYISLPTYMLFFKTLALKHQKVPMVLLPSSIGPLKGGIKDWIVKKGLMKFEYIYIRDQITYDHLSSFNLENIKLVHDAAFILEPASEKRINQIFKNEDIFDVPFIGLNISILLYHEFMKMNRDYIQIMVKLINHLKEKYNLPILLVPHQIFPEIYDVGNSKRKSKGGDDRYAIKILMDKIEDNKNIFTFQNHYSAPEIKGIINKCRIFIGGRMHSIIGSISQNIPSLIIGYSHKALGMMKMINLEKYVWNINSDFNTLIKKITDLWENKEIIENYLKKQNKAIKTEIYNILSEINTNLTKKGIKK